MLENGSNLDFNAQSGEPFQTFKARSFWRKGVLFLDFVEILHFIFSANSAVSAFIVVR